MLLRYCVVGVALLCQGFKGWALRKQECIVGKALVTVYDVFGGEI